MNVGDWRKELIDSSFLLQEEIINIARNIATFLDHSRITGRHAFKFNYQYRQYPILEKNLIHLIHYDSSWYPECYSNPFINEEQKKQMIL